jgi:large subunit ribosomal protein L29
MNKRNEAIKLLRDMSDTELDDHLRQQRRKLFEMRFQQATGQVENHREIRVIRREIARTMTVQIEVQSELVATAAGAHAAPAGREPEQRQDPAAPVAAEPEQRQDPAADQAPEDLSLSDVEAPMTAGGDVDE